MKKLLKIFGCGRKVKKTRKLNSYPKKNYDNSNDNDKTRREQVNTNQNENENSIQQMSNHCHFPNSNTMGELNNEDNLNNSNEISNKKNKEVIHGVISRDSDKELGIELEKSKDIEEEEINDSANKNENNEKNKKVEEDEKENNENISNKENIKITGLNLNEIIGDDEPLIDSSSSLINEYEKNIIQFTKKGLVDFCDKIENLDGYKQYYNKNNLTILLKNDGSPLSDKFPICKALYVQKKSELEPNSNLENVIKIMYDANIRKAWDKNTKIANKIDGNDQVYIWQTGSASFLLISPRDVIEKRFNFKYNNNYYVLSTSVPIDTFPQEEGSIRIFSYINFFKVKEDEENYYFLTLNQTDYKMVIPQMIINITLPMTTSNWFKNFRKACNEIESITPESIEKYIKSKDDD